MKVRTHVLARIAVAAGAVATLVIAPSPASHVTATTRASMIASTPERVNDLVLIRDAQQRASRAERRAVLLHERKIEWHRRVVARAMAIQAAREAQRAHARAASTFAAGDSATWARQPFSIRVANCESGGGPSDHHTYYDGNPHLRDPNGHDGKWQFAPSTWWSVGGTGNAADASEAEQDYRAWLLWKRDGWGQWECAGLVG